ncbi:MAG: hypothetical protein IPM22_14505 [Betaproteobacteria bacterium]|nr:hypothetical protein [Betaproteobacteria bacterium]
MPAIVGRRAGRRRSFGARDAQVRARPGAAAGQRERMRRRAGEREHREQGERCGQPALHRVHSTHVRPARRRPMSLRDGVG